MMFHLGYIKLYVKYVVVFIYAVLHSLSWAVLIVIQFALRRIYITSFLSKMSRERKWIHILKRLKNAVRLELILACLQGECLDHMHTV